MQQHKQIKTTTSQNIRQKLGLKDSLTNINQIYSQPHSSKGTETRKKENVQDCNTMKKKLFNMLGQNYNSNKAFSISPTNSLKQNYFVSTSTQQNSKQLIQKQNHTLDCHISVVQNLLGNSVKNVQSQPSLNQFEKYTTFLENQNFENHNNPSVNPSQKVGITKPNSTQSRNHKTDRSSLIALFEKLHEKDSSNKHRKQTSQNSNYVVNVQKQQPQECFYTELKFRQKIKGSLSNNSSGQLCSHLNPNSSSTQIQQNQQNNIDDNLQQLGERMQYILNNYHQKLKQVDFEKEVLIQEIQYWKSKYQKCQQKSSIS